jgi:hypothetical protein
MFLLHPQKHNVLPQKLGPQKLIQKSLQIKKLLDMKSTLSPKNHG